MESVEKLPVFVSAHFAAGQKNYSRYLQGKTVRERPAAVSGRLYFVEAGGYPCLTEGKRKVRGELMEIIPERYGRGSSRAG